MNELLFNFLPKSIEHIPENRYKELESYTEIMDAFSRITNQSVYLIDFYKGEACYISDNPMFLCGLSPNEVRSMKGNFNEINVPEADIVMNRKITTEWFKFINEVPLEEKKNYTIRYDYHIQKQLVSYTSTPVFFDEAGHVWIGLCTVNKSTSIEPGNVKIFKKNSRIYWEFNFTSDQWVEATLIELSEMEKQVIRLAIQGNTESEIAEKVFRSKDAIKSIKRRLFETLGVNNITEAVSYAINYKLI